MNKITLLALCILVFAVMGGGAYAAPETGDEVAGRAPVDVDPGREIVDLAKKYDATAKLPASVVTEGKSCTRGEAAVCILAVIEKVLEKCGKEGKDAVAQEDLERLASLHEALKDELSKHERYLTLREAIEAVLAKPEQPAFEFKVGVNGSVRGEGVGNFRLPDFSYTPGHSEGRFLYRVKPYAYWHPVDWLDIHAEGQSYGFTGGSQYSGKVSLYQGYVEAKAPGTELAALKVGRQELVYGGAFVLGSDSFYDGLTFDALRLRIRPAGPLTVDLFGGWYATPFSDGVRGSLAGGYITWSLAEGSSLEAYGFRDTGSTESHSGEHRNTWGARGTAKIGAVSLEVEPVWQTGRVFNANTGGFESIRAWGGHADLSMDTELLGRTNRLFLSYARGSGDSGAPAGGSVRKEFTNSLTDSSLTGDMNVVGDLSGLDVGDHHASGMQIFTLGWGVDISKELNFSATGRYFLADEVEAGFSRNIGLETDFILTYAVNDNLSVIAGYDRFFTGGFFRDATGSTKDIDYGYLMLQFDISKSKPKLKPVKG